MNVPERIYATVVINGERRPYNIITKIFRQHRDKHHHYSSPVLDQKLSHDLASRIREGLANRREDMNVIDDFRAF